MPREITVAIKFDSYEELEAFAIAGRIAPTVKALKELELRVLELKEEKERLEAEINELRKKKAEVLSSET